jgi:hypothetical protein
VMVNVAAKELEEKLRRQPSVVGDHLDVGATSSGGRGAARLGRSREAAGQ